MKKYVFKPYGKIFPELFLKEKERISGSLGAGAVIEHVGSTAVPGLGGNGIIDIAIHISIPWIGKHFHSIKSSGILPNSFEKVMRKTQRCSS